MHAFFFFNAQMLNQGLILHLVGRSRVVFKYICKAVQIPYIIQPSLLLFIRVFRRRYCDFQIIAVFIVDKTK